MLASMPHALDDTMLSFESDSSQESAEFDAESNVYMGIKVSDVSQDLKVVQLDQGKAVQFTGTVGVGSRSIRTNEPILKPKAVVTRKTTKPPPSPKNNNGRKTSFRRLGKKKQPEPQPIVTEIVTWNAFVDPFMLRTGKMYDAARMVTYFETEILAAPREKVAEEESSTQEEAQDETLEESESKKGHAECIAVGMSGTTFKDYKSMPGWDRSSCGYHGDDGSVFVRRNKTGEYGPTFGVGDVVGCGADFETKRIFYTLNGQFLGYTEALKYADLKENWYPTIGLDTQACVQFNFGKDKPFAFDLHSMIENGAPEVNKARPTIERQDTMESTSTVYASSDSDDGDIKDAAVVATPRSLLIVEGASKDVREDLVAFVEDKADDAVNSMPSTDAIVEEPTMDTHVTATPKAVVEEEPVAAVEDKADDAIIEEATMISSVTATPVAVVAEEPTSVENKFDGTSTDTSVEEATIDTGVTATPEVVVEEESIAAVEDKADDLDAHVTATPEAVVEEEPIAPGEAKTDGASTDAIVTMDVDVTASPEAVVEEETVAQVEDKANNFSADAIVEEATMDADVTASPEAAVVEETVALVEDKANHFSADAIVEETTNDNHVTATPEAIVEEETVSPVEDKANDVVAEMQSTDAVAEEATMDVDVPATPEAVVEEETVSLVEDKANDVVEEMPSTDPVVEEATLDVDVTATPEAVVEEETVSIVEDKVDDTVEEVPNTDAIVEEATKDNHDMTTSEAVVEEEAVPPAEAKAEESVEVMPSTDATVEEAILDADVTTTSEAVVEEETVSVVDDKTDDTVTDAIVEEATMDKHVTVTHEEEIVFVADDKADIAVEEMPDSDAVVEEATMDTHVTIDTMQEEGVGFEAKCVILEEVGLTALTEDEAATETVEGAMNESVASELNGDTVPSLEEKVSTDSIAENQVEEEVVSSDFVHPEVEDIAVEKSTADSFATMAVGAVVAVGEGVAGQEFSRDAEAKTESDAELSVTADEDGVADLQESIAADEVEIVTDSTGAAQPEKTVAAQDTAVTDAVLVPNEPETELLTEVASAATVDATSDDAPEDKEVAESALAERCVADIDPTPIAGFVAKIEIALKEFGIEHSRAAQLAVTDAILVAKEKLSAIQDISKERIADVEVENLPLLATGVAVSIGVVAVGAGFLFRKRS